MDLIRYLMERGAESESMRNRRHRRRFSESAAGSRSHHNHGDDEDDEDMRNIHDNFDRNMNILDMLTNMHVQ